VEPEPADGKAAKQAGKPGAADSAAATNGNAEDADTAAKEAATASTSNNRAGIDPIVARLVNR
jgi:hypothetical protein